jgi:transposase
MTTKRAGRKAKTPVTIDTDQRARDAFLDTLRAGLTITEAAKAAGVLRRTVYRWRDADEDFATEWDEAYDEGTDAFEAEARRRAVDGVQKPVVAMGKVAKNDDGTVLMVTEYSDTLMLASLKRRRPEAWRERVDVNAKHSGGVTVNIGAADADL